MTEMPQFTVHKATKSLHLRRIEVTTWGHVTSSTVIKTIWYYAYLAYYLVGATVLTIWVRLNCELIPFLNSMKNKVPRSSLHTLIHQPSLFPFRYRAEAFSVRLCRHALS